MKNIVSVVILIVLSVISLQALEYKPTPKDKKCLNHNNACRDCIQEPACQWCSHMKMNNESKHKCFSIETHLNDFCDISNIERVENSEIEYTINKPFTQDIDDVAKDERIIQLKPQQLKLSLKKGVAKRFKLQYRQVKDYPLDLYYLMDLSSSMEEDKDTLAKLGVELASTMRKLTSQFKIGFGSFVDKVVSPFVNIHPTSLRYPVRTKKNKPRTVPFSFKNNLKLTTEEREFTKQVSYALTALNQDSPEGGFDALMQVMVCDDNIGWREDVRKIIVYSTDAGVHIAGDGRLGGIVLPNDEKCHLNSNEFYDKYDVYDYPSIGQIKEKAEAKNFNIIFAVSTRYHNPKIYKNIAGRIDGAAFAELTARSQNVIKIIGEVYQNITGKVKITRRAGNDVNLVSSRIFSKCNDPTGPLVERNVCFGVKEGQTFDFTVELKLEKCIPGMKNITVTLGTEQKVDILIEPLCDCNCENEGAKETRDIEQPGPCAKGGTFQCGVCYCDRGRYGSLCQCSLDEDSSHLAAGNSSKCKEEGSKQEDPVCNGRGKCECETCICRNPEFITGRFCQCNLARCIANGDVSRNCSGNGYCDCDHCQCSSGWDGQFCQCKEKAECISKDDGEYCSGHGDCECGKCICKVKNGVVYSGKYCEECPSCNKGKCREFQDCVQCDVYNSGVLEGKACSSCTLKGIQQLATLEDPIDLGATLCTFLDESTGCEFNFTYQYIDPRHRIFALNKQICPKNQVLAATLGAIGGIVALGILTLILWKVLTTIHDRREFARFEDDQRNAKWEAADNPLYKTPTTTFANPAFKAPTDEQENLKI